MTTTESPTKENYNQFIRGVASSLNVSRMEADEQWAGYSRHLGDEEREYIESGGFERGLTIGAEIQNL